MVNGYCFSFTLYWSMGSGFLPGLSLGRFGFSKLGKLNLIEI
jgi:hypothetical protein